MTGETPALTNAGLISHWGQGPATVLALHGMTGCGLDFPALSVETPALGSERSWVAPDLPGHASHRPGPGSPVGAAGLTWFSTLDWIENIARRLRFEGRAVHLLGYSLGGRMALALLTRSPQLFDSAVIISASPGITRPSLRAQRREADKAWAEKAEHLPLEEFMREWKGQPLLAGQLSLPAAPDSPDAIGRRERLASHTGQGLASALRAFSPGTAPAAAERIHFYHPTLLVAGERDPAYRAHAAELAQRLPYPTVRVVSDSGHAPHLENPGSLGDLLAGFWKLPH